MGKASPDRGAAEAAVKLASKSDDSEFKAIVLNIAQQWLDLAHGEKLTWSRAMSWLRAAVRCQQQDDIYIDDSPCSLTGWCFKDG
jgi:hypothetical protein